MNRPVRHNELDRAPAEGRLPGPSERSSNSADADLVFLARTVAHRLRGFLTGIEGFAGLLAESESAAEEEYLLARIFEGIRGADHVLQEIEEYVQPTVLTRQVVGLQALLQSALLEFHEDELSRIQIDLRVDNECALNVAPTLFSRVVSTLVNNALDATPVDSADVALEALCDHETGEAVVRVINPGAITDEGVASRIFVPFFTTKVKNLGLGLAHALRITGAHGGTLVLAANDQRSGTCFELRLPLAV